VSRARTTVFRHLPLGAKLLALSTTLVIVTAMATSIASYRFARESLLERIEDQLRGVTDERRRSLIQYLDHQGDRIRLIGSRTWLRRHVATLTESPGDQAALLDSQTILLDAQRSLENIRRITIIDSERMVLTSTDSSQLGQRIDLPFIPRPDASLHVGLPRSTPDGYRLSIAAPLRWNRREIGTIVVTVDAEPLQELVRPPTQASSSQTVLGFRDPRDSVLLLVPRRTELETVNIALDPAYPISRALMGDAGFGRANDYRGVDVLAAYAPLAHGWGVVSKIDAAEALAPIADLRTRLMLITGFVTLLGLGLAHLVARALRRPLIDLARTVNALAAGGLETRAPVRSNDELGELAKAFNVMAAELEGSQRTLAERAAALAISNEQLRHSNDELRRFSRAASHDLQEPLRMVSSFVQLLERRYAGKLDARADRYIHFATDGARRMQAMIRGLRSYAEADESDTLSEVVDCNRVVRDAIANLQLLIEETHAKVQVLPLPRISGNADQLTRMFQNLIDNALRYRGTATPLIEVGARTEGEDLIVYVRDNGIGIESTFHARVFEAFARLHNHSEHDGSGLGLAVVDRIAARHGGRITLESKPGVGSTFSLRISTNRVAS
jgi:signal transduction histidine kinase